MEMMITYWIWYGQELLDTVRLPQNSSRLEVLGKSVDMKRRVPMYPDTINGTIGKLLSGNVEIKTYEGEN